QGFQVGRPSLARLAGERLRDRAGDHRPDLQAPPADLRAAYLLLRPDLRRGQEDHLARRLQGCLGADSRALLRLSDATPTVASTNSAGNATKRKRGWSAVM